VGAFVLAACLALLPVPAARVFVYSYAYESGKSADIEKAYGLDKMDPGGGGTFMFHNVNQHYRSPSFAASEARHGTIAVEVVREESDGGLVLRVSEPAPPNPLGGDASGATCVAFGDTTVVCDPNRTISPETVALLGLLGKDFVDASRVDAARHWRVTTAGGYATTADFTIERSSGTKLAIVERAVRERPGSSEKVDVTASIVYDETRSVPLSVDEATVERTSRGDVVSETVSSHVTLTLVSP
jgi:hypothetical protein